MNIDFNELLKRPDLTTSERLGIYAAMYEKEGKLEEAYNAYLSEAEKGNAEAMFYIGNLYFFSLYEAKSDKGRGALMHALQHRGGMMMPWNMVERKIPNFEKALEWYLKSAEAGWVPGMVSAGCMLHQGQGMKKDDEKAKQLLMQAADLGDNRAKGALKDFFGVEHSITYTMAEYRQMLLDFEAEKGDVHALYYQLLLGSPLQLYKLGYVLAKLHYSKEGYLERFPFALRPDKRPYAPIDHWRCDWGSTLVVNMDAFDQEEFTLSYATDSAYFRDPDPLKWMKFDPEKNEIYTGKPFSWTKYERYGSLLEVSRKYGYLGQPEDGEEIHAWDENPCLFLKRDDEFRVEHMKFYHRIQENNNAVFYDCPEKEFDIEICHVEENGLFGTFTPIFRYTDF